METFAVRCSVSKTFLRARSPWTREREARCAIPAATSALQLSRSVVVTASSLRSTSGNCSNLIPVSHRDIRLGMRTRDFFLFFF